MQLPQISCGRQAGSLAQSGSSQSTRPSWSLSMPSVHCSGPQPGMSAWPQTPPVQVSAVQLFSSLQSAAVSQRWQPGMEEIWQLPSAPQASVVQGFSSLQLAAVTQGTQAAWEECSQTPFALQVSVVQPFWSLQSAAVVQGTQSAMVK